MSKRVRGINQTAIAKPTGESCLGQTRPDRGGNLGNGDGRIKLAL